MIKKKLFKTFSAMKRFVKKNDLTLSFKKINKLYTDYICKLYFSIYIIFIISLLIININFHIIIK